MSATTVRVTLTHDDGSVGEYDVERIAVQTFEDSPVSIRAADHGYAIVIEPMPAKES